MVFVTACSSLPGLRVLTGEESDETLTERAVESVDWVMADKTDRTDPSLIEAGTRIENANQFVDVIEIRPGIDPNTNQSLFVVNMLFRPPRTANTLQGEIERLEAIRRSIEIVWQGTVLESEGSQILVVRLYTTGEIVTLDNGNSVFGALTLDTRIDRSLALSYMQDVRNLETFVDLILNGALSYTSPEQLVLYEGTPNHPMFMYPTIQTTNRDPG
jgi:hypothetical protein